MAQGKGYRWVHCRHCWAHRCRLEQQSVCGGHRVAAQGAQVGKGADLGALVGAEHTAVRPGEVTAPPSGQQSAVSSQWSVVSGQQSALSGQWSVLIGQRSAVSGQWSSVIGQHSALSCMWVWVVLWVCVVLCVCSTAAVGCSLVSRRSVSSFR